LVLNLETLPSVAELMSQLTVNETWGSFRSRKFAQDGRAVRRL